ncbi:MAG: hypothetical protein SFY96_10390 [Planctomycetota bacterium]|nr:hypothetical protein [Planctomycetota bacterium]
MTSTAAKGTKKAATAVVAMAGMAATAAARTKSMKVRPSGSFHSPTTSR